MRKLGCCMKLKTQNICVAKQQGRNWKTKSFCAVYPKAK